MGFPTKNDHFGVFWGYHHFRKHSNLHATKINALRSLDHWIGNRCFWTTRDIAFKPMGGLGCVKSVTHGSGSEAQMAVDLMDLT